MRSLILLTIISISITFCSTKRPMNNEFFIERYMQQVGNNSLNWMELTYHKDSVIGVFYGFEKIPNSRTIYYKSIMEELELTDKSIKFVIRNYSFGDKPFVDGEVWEELIIKDVSILPALLRFPQNFSGVKSSSDLKLKRTSMLYDSKFDELILIKVNRQ